MAYELHFRPQAIRELDGIDPSIRKRILSKLTWFVHQSDPLSFAHRLTNADLGDYRFRIGTWRVIFDVKDNQYIVLSIGHRSEIYR